MGCGQYFCSPFCGNCKPGTMKIVACPQCGTSFTLKRVEVLAGQPQLCEKCGFNLVMELRSTHTACAYSGLECSFPCGRAQKGNPDGTGFKTCLSNIPPLAE